MPRGSPPPPTDALIVLRALRGWRQNELAAAAGVGADRVGRYETGRTKIPAEELRRLVAVMGFPPVLIERANAFGRMAREARELYQAGKGLPAGLQASIEAISAEAALSWENLFRETLVRFQIEGAILDARRQAPALWARLRRYTAEQRRELVADGQEFQSWALCELVCAESAEAAADSAGTARELAELALAIAERTAGESPAPSCLQGYAWSFVGNARRVGGDLPGADAAFARSAELWQAGGGEGGGGPLDAARLLDLESSLRRAQRRFPEALALIDRALATGPAGNAAARLLLNRAKTLEALGDYPAAIATLRQASPLIDAEGEPRLLLVQRFNLTLNLCHIGCPLEAQSLLAGVRASAAKVSKRLDLVRLRWLEGKVAAGMRRPEEAIAALKQVRDRFVAERLPYDAALVTVELAEVYAAEGRSEEVKALARRSVAVLKAQGVPVEAARALKLFREAAEQERLSVALAQRVIAYLYRARHDPQLPFEAAA